MKKRLKTSRKPLVISRTLKKRVLLCVMAHLSITDIYAMDRPTPDRPKSPQQLNDLNCFLMRLAQEDRELHQSVEAAIPSSQDCAIDLRNIISYLHELAKNYRPESPGSCRTLISAQAVLDRLDTCINQYATKPHMINPGISIFMPADQRRHFIQETVGEAYFTQFNYALTKLKITYPR